MTDTNRYGPTAARKQGKPGREGRPKSTTIDIHSHVAVPAARAIAQPHLDLSQVPLAAYAVSVSTSAQFAAGGASHVTSTQGSVVQALVWHAHGIRCSA